MMEKLEVITLGCIGLFYYVVRKHLYRQKQTEFFVLMAHGWNILKACDLGMRTSVISTGLAAVKRKFKVESKCHL